MKLDVKELGPLRKAIKVDIPEDVVNRKFQEIFFEISRKIQIPGFRQGKIPINILEKRFANEAKDDVVKSLIPDYYERAMKELGIMPVADPMIDDIMVNRNAPLSFTATVEVKPQIELGNYIGVKLKKKKITITDEDVDKVLVAMQEYYGELVVLEDEHVTVNGDHLIIDFEGFLDGKPVENGKAEGLLVRIGDKVLLPDFEEQIKGRKKGDEFEIKVEIPEGGRLKVPIPGQPYESVAKIATFNVKVKEVKKKNIPNIDEDFAKDAGAASLVELRERIKKDLLDGREREVETSNRNLLVKQLAEMHTFEIPETLVEMEVHDMMEITSQQIHQSGKSPEEVGFDPDKARQEFEKQGRSNIKSALILEAIADKEGITVQIDDLDDEVKGIAEAAKKPVEEVRRLLLLQEGAMNDIKARVLGKKVMDFVYSKAIFEEEVEAS